MKKLLAMVCMVFGCAFAAKASGEARTSGKKGYKLDKKIALVAEKRANYLSDMMIRELGLNNYQARKMREINKQVVEQKMAIETEFKGNQEMINKLCKDVCSERDRELENVLSTRQYNEYFGHRKIYDTTEKEFMASVNDTQKSDQTATNSMDKATKEVSLN
jgi:hypothetical protein